MLILRRTLLLMTFGVWGSGLWAQDALPLPEPLEPAHCGPREIGTDAGRNGEFEMEAGQMKREGDRVELSSDVRLRHGPWRARAESIVADVDKEHAELDGGVHVSGPGVVMEAERMKLNYARKHAEVENARFRVASGAAGQARRLVRSEDGLVEAESVIYTTCALDDPDWSLHAGTVRIDPEQRQGEARNATLKVGSVPILYLPWIGFPIGDARKSGWLVPEVGTSDDLGYSLELPYYLNLAPHYDAVLSTRYMGRRGLQIKPSGRYRTHHGSGAVRAEFLSDNKADDDRYLMHWRHSGVRPSGWDYQVNYTDVSDREYQEDFRSGIHGLSVTRLRQEAGIAWRSSDWTFSAELQGSDPLKDEIEQWDRMPKIRTKGTFRVPSIGLVLSPSLAVDAFRGDLDTLHYQGERYDASLVMSRRFAGAGWQVTPRLQWRHTHYDLTYSDTAEAAAEDLDVNLDHSPSRTLPIFSVDARARFERQLENGALQTLEPRLFYFNRQRRDHSDIPIFDSRRMEPDFDTMFRIARAVGPDRVGAADLMAAGLTTRIIDPASGYLKLRARLGRIWYFRSPGGLIKGGEGDDSKSAWAAEVEVRPVPQLEIRTALRFDPGHEGDNTTWASHMIGWNGANDERFQVRYLRRAGGVEYVGNPVLEEPGEPALEQADAQALMPLGGNWQLAFRYRYDLRESRSIELLSALEYQGCCMTMGIGAWKVRRDGEDPGEEYKSRLLLRVRFHGLTDLGQDVMTHLRGELDGEPVWSH